MSNNNCDTAMPLYRCHKEVSALKIKEIIIRNENEAELVIGDGVYAPITVTADYVHKHQPKPGGYYVVYKDGYESFSPADAFESGYSRI